MNVIVTDNNIHIEDSYIITKRAQMREILNSYKAMYPKCNVFKRKTISLIHEWVTHNRLYKLGLWKNRTKDVDLDYPQKWYYTLAYFILGI